MRQLEPAELRLLNRLVIAPNSHQADIAKELGITRSSVNQVWRRLERDCGLTVRSAIDYGKLGLQLVFGWAIDREPSNSLNKIETWLRSTPFVSLTLPSIISSVMDSRVYFEAVVPVGADLTKFCDQLERFTKMPYSLTVEYDIAEMISDHMNLGPFDGSDWNVQNDFRFHASIDAVKSYTDILPAVGMLRLSHAAEASNEQLVLALCIESDHNVTSSKVLEVLESLEKQGLRAPPCRSLRRHMAKFRGRAASPFVEIEDIGLEQRVIVCVSEKGENRTASRLLHAQADTFPKVHMVAGRKNTVLDLWLPPSVEWATLTASLVQIASPFTEVSTFMTGKQGKRKALERVVPYALKKATQKQS